MRKRKMGLASFFLVATCIMLLLIASYERMRSNALESISIAVSDPDVRALLEDELDLMEREAELQMEMAKFEKEKLKIPFDMSELDVPTRAELANLRNLKLKLIRERKKLIGIRTDLIKDKAK